MTPKPTHIKPDAFPAHTALAKEAESIGAHMMPGYKAELHNEFTQLLTLCDGMATALKAAEAVWSYTDTITNNMAITALEKALAKYAHIKDGKHE